MSTTPAFIGLFGAIAGLGLQGIVVRDIVRDRTRGEETLGTAAVLQLIGGAADVRLARVARAETEPIARKCCGGLRME